MLKEFLLAGPEYFGAINYLAHRRTIELIWNDEIGDKNSAYARREGQTLMQRLEPIALLGHAEGVDDDAFNFWFHCVELYAHSVDIDDDDGTSDITDLLGRHAELVKFLQPQESNFPKLSGIMTVNQAATASFWE